jgi:peptide/nickel transport system substrate-binding protein
MHASGADVRRQAFASLVADALSGRVSRRDLFARATALGVAGAVGGSLATGALAAPAARTVALPASRQDDPGTLVLAMNGSPSDLDPHSAYDYRSSVAVRGVYETLIALVGSSPDTYEGLVAESWEANDDKSVWTFKIRPGITFQDGTPCDAAAVVASFNRFLTLGMGPVGVIGRFVTDAATQISAPDAATVVFALGTPQPLFEAAIAASYGPFIVNVAALTANEDAGDLGHTWAMTNAEGTGTGPWKIVDFQPEQQLVFERNETYWRGWDGAHFDRIVIRVVAEAETRRQLIETGDADIVDNLTPEALEALSGNADLKIDRSYTNEVDYLMMAVTGPLATPAARRAMCYAYPYTEVIDGVYRGFGKQAIGAVAELCHGFDPNTFVYTTDLEQAKALLAEAGVAEGTQMTLLQESGDENVKSANVLFQANLAQIGIELSIETTDLTTFAGLIFSDVPVEERPHFVPWFWWPDYNDAWNHLYPQVATAAGGSGGTNGGWYSNAEVDTLLEEARVAPDEATYLAAISRIQQILAAEDPPAIYYLQREWTTVLRNDIAGFAVNPIYIGTFDFYNLSRAI